MPPHANIEAVQPPALVDPMKAENILRAEKTAKIKMISAAPDESLAVESIALELEQWKGQ